MHRASVRIGAVFAVLLACAAVVNARAAEPSVDEARKVAEQWIALVDAGRYDDS
jgi:hypothetical protein